MTVVPFPILRLPQRVHQKCLKQMGQVERVSLAILSENISKRVGKLQLRPYGSRIPGKSSMWTYLKQYHFQFSMYDFKPVQISLRLHELVNNPKETLPGFTTKQFFQAVRIFIQHNRVSLTCPSGNSIKVLYEYIKNLRITTLALDSSQTQDYRLLKIFPSLEELSVHEGSISKLIFPQNLEILNLYSVTVTLDDILLSNCSEFSIDHVFSDKEMNTFLKHWIRGCMPRLKDLHFYARELEQDELEQQLEQQLEISFVKTVLFEGINYKEINYCVGNAFETERYDGTKGYVWFEVLTNGLTFQFSLTPFPSYY